MKGTFVVAAKCCFPQQNSKCMEGQLFQGSLRKMLIQMSFGFGSYLSHTFLEGKKYEKRTMNLTWSALNSLWRFVCFYCTSHLSFWKYPKRNITFMMTLTLLLILNSWIIIPIANLTTCSVQYLVETVQNARIRIAGAVSGIVVGSVTTVRKKVVVLLAIRSHAIEMFVKGASCVSTVFRVMGNLVQSQLSRIEQV